MRSTTVTPARGEEKGRLGALLAGTGHRGAAARPLDGGALTRWGARTPARGPAMVPWLSLFACSSLGHGCCAEERAERGEERERATKNELGFP